jgi:hypothetical protein
MRSLAEFSAGDAEKAAANQQSDSLGSWFRRKYWKENVFEL